MDTITFTSVRASRQCSIPVANDHLAFEGSVSVGSLDPEALSRTDPGALIGLAIRFGVMGRVSREGVPPMVREGLRYYAQMGELACAMILDWLDDLLLADLETVARTASLPS